MGELSLTDDLTGLRNRRGFVALAGHQLELARTGRGEAGLLLVYADMDGLKRINDLYGHQVGSDAIKEAADLFRRAFRDTDLVARLGGDEFAALAVGAGEGAESEISVRLRELFRARNSLRRSPYDLSLSVGMAAIPNGCPVTLDELLSAADRRMYEPKRLAHRRGGEIPTAGAPTHRLPTTTQPEKHTKGPLRNVCPLPGASPGRD